MTREDFLGRIDEIMCGTSNAERAYLAVLYDEVTAPHWISVEDELPPRENEFHMSIDVLATDGEIILKSFYDYDLECWVCFEARWCFATVTHWMPLPQAPHHIIDVNKKEDRVIGTADHIKTALDVLNKKGGGNENS